jgi:hypothetical protein
MLNDDLIWEVAGKSYRSIYNERLGRQQRIPDRVAFGNDPDSDRHASAIEDMKQRG